MENYTHDSLRQLVFQLKVDDEASFSALALAIYDLQFRACLPYREWVECTNSRTPADYTEVPRMHISAFKSQKVVSAHGAVETVFTSSGTSGTVSSKHQVYDLDAYLQNTVRGFETFYSPIENTCVLGLLPSYMERTGSSLVAMVDHFVRRSYFDSSGTYLHNHEELFRVLQTCKEQDVNTVLIGVSFGLLDFVEDYTVDFPELVVMETGGMKGRREEMSRTKLHNILKAGFGVPTVHSEYGMTELLSQAYSQGGGVFRCPASMRVIITDMNDPLTVVPTGTTGILNVIDLANIDSCSFIVTDDIGKQYADGSFEVLGRLDQSDVRGCNLMVSDLD